MPKQLELFSANHPKFPSTRYQGSKSKFSNWIWDCIKHIPFNTVLDAFGGTGSVSYRLKQEGKSVTYNDILPCNHVIGKALIENQNVTIDESDLDYILTEHNEISYPKFIYSTFKDIYYTEDENEWLDKTITNIRTLINPYKQALAYFALFQACLIKRPYNLFHRKNLYTRLSNVKRSFGNKKTWDTSFATHFTKFVKEGNHAIFNNNHNCISLNYDVFKIDETYDLVYVDPPYFNKKGMGINYADFYHFLNGILYYDTWGSRIDYNSKNLKLLSQPNIWSNSKTITTAFKQVFSKFKESILVISYRSDGTPTISEIADLLKDFYPHIDIHYSNEIKYALSSTKCTEVLIVAQP